MMRGLRASLRRFLSCRGGGYTVFAAIILPVIAGISGAAVDFYVYADQQKQLQNVADSAALAATREAALEGWSQATAEAVVDNFLEANFKSIGAGSAVYTSHVEVDQTNRRVSVTIDQDHYGYFVAGYFKHSPQIRVNAVAQTSGSTNICVIGLDKATGGAIGLKDAAVISAPDCAVYSNSTDTQGLQSIEDSLITASLACSAGGYQGASKNFNKLPLTDCPAVSDPLASRAPPPAGSCPLISLAKVLEGLPVMIVERGTHCGGLTIKGYTKAIFAPGVHVFKNGPLIVDDNAIVDGLGGVGLYFTGNNAYFEFKKNARVSLQAPSSGDMVGLLMFQDRASPPQTFKITSDYTRKLIGTIYLPNGELSINAKNGVADESAYTAIVVKKLKLLSSPKLVLNTDYDKTTVPVPDGLGPSNGELRLVE